MTLTHIWWIRRDIRLQDNPALMAALEQAGRFLPLFILEPSLMSKAAPRRRAFLLQALEDLDAQLQARGSRLIVRQGSALAALYLLAEELGEVQIFAHEDFSPFAKTRDEKIMQQLSLTLFPGLVIRQPDQVLKADGSPYLVYTPYKNSWFREPLPMPGDCLIPPDQFPPLPAEIKSDELPSAEVMENFPATADEAQQRLAAFTQAGLQRYQSQRDRLAQEGTSRLSPYLRFGLISARECFSVAHIAQLQARDDRTRAEIQTWMDELVWREFYTAILAHFPKVMAAPFRESYAQISWRDAPEDLAAWQQGQTGFPIVDACMRQLLSTGWMHNRGRMIVASFLTKDLLINWQLGEAWFMANLVDGDPAANNGGWQWSAGTGTDAAPYFRIFNPILQGKKFDPDGAYISQWVPELRALPVRLRHEPWKITETESHQYGFVNGKHYPRQIVGHAFARQRTLAAYRFAKTAYQEEV